MSADAVAALFGDDGTLAQRLPGFRPRRQQQEMAAAVAAAMEDAAVLLVEAGTGTGKTFAYLAPALASGRRILVSTGTKNLQDQLFHRDLPRLVEALGQPLRSALLKGHANYLCRYRLERSGDQPGLRFDERLRKVQRWAQSTERGEIAELGWLTEDDPLVPRITSSADNCLGAKCPEFAACHVVRARRAAQAADLVVVNHHLLLADFALKEEGFGELLPNPDAVVIDEAHQLPDLALQFFGTRLSTRQLRDLAEDVQSEAGLLGDMPELDAANEALVRPLLPLEALLSRQPARGLLEPFRRAEGSAVLLDQTEAALDALSAQLKRYAERSPGLAAAAERAAGHLHRLRVVLDPEADRDQVQWIEPRGRGGALHATPLSVGREFQRVIAAYPGAWVLTSATLSVRGDFSHLQRQLGLDQARTLALDSPFDYPRQARLYLPEGLPEPAHPAFSDRVVDALLPLIEASRGGAFVLCTSHRALKIIAARLRAVCPYPLFVQNEDARSRLVERFSAAGDGVLVGTASFWEGVDVRGRALRLVAIDKLPFAAPGDPVYDARLEAHRAEGGNPFTEIQLPEAVMTLRQGVGRLIRDAGDRGLLVICDPRLTQKPYGRRVLESLPAMPRVDRAAALDWAASL
ncbi:MAG TPA: ATP-dependent DNA helicase [Nevskiaceae bacterium]|nr:ATP-dependent DNA helicase [Nevskiaceae bacterium]